MKLKFSNYVGAVTLLAALAIPAGLAAQNGNTQHHRYKLIDLGTLGGPSAYKSVNAPGYQILNNAGEIAFSADTAVPDPNCANRDCCVSRATRWQNGTLTDLGALPGEFNSSYSGAINARGWATGQSASNEIDPRNGLYVTRATLWQGDQIIDLGSFGGHWSLGITLNDAGDVVGFAANPILDPYSFFPPAGTQIRAFLWREGVLLDLGTLGGNDSMASSINQNGQVLGNSYTNTIPNQTTGVPTIHPFIWQGGRMTDLGTLGGTYAGEGNLSFTYEGSLLINDQGQVIGTSNLAGDQIFHPFLWESGKMKDLGTLGGDNGTATWLTNNGEVVGEADVPGSQAYHGFLWKDGVMTDLGTLTTDQCSRALMANSKGQVVGGTLAVCQVETTRAFLWENGGPIVDLNSLTDKSTGALLYEADNINERGEIVASGLPAGCSDRYACQHLYFLIPCDENHPGVEGCDYSLADAAAGSSRTTPAVRDARNGTLPWSRNGQRSRFRIPGRAIGATN